MKSRFIPMIVASLALIAGLALLIMSGGAQAQDNTAKPRPLTNANADEVAQLALNYTQNQFRVVSGVPAVLLARRVSSKDLPSLGIAGLDYLTADEPLMLVIMRGDFDVSNMIGHTADEPASRVGYIAYLYDLWAGTPTAIMTSPNGGRFRTALNDPNLPEDLPVTPAQSAGMAPVTGPQVAPPTALPPSSNKLPYGAVALPVTTAAPGTK